MLVAGICVMAAVVTTLGIFSSEGPGPFTHESIRGLNVAVYGRGLYRHMSAEVAPQGIAQDYVTLCIGIPLLLFSLVWARSGAIRGKVLLTGVLGYFLVTYLFYTAMAMYNEMFLAYVFLLSTSFFAFARCFSNLSPMRLNAHFKAQRSLNRASIILLMISLAIALLWLSIVVVPLIDGTIIPQQVEHYTTLIVQGFDLALLLPLAVVSAITMLQKKPLAYLMLPVYFVFLTLMMTALTAKIVAMAYLGYSVVPAIFIIPAFNLLCLGCTADIFRNVCETDPSMPEQSAPKGPLKLQDEQAALHQY